MRVYGWCALCHLVIMGKMQAWLSGWIESIMNLYMPGLYVWASSSTNCYASSCILFEGSSRRGKQKHLYTAWWSRVYKSIAHLLKYAGSRICCQRLDWTSVEFCALSFETTGLPTLRSQPLSAPACPKRRAMHGNSHTISETRKPKQSTADGLHGGADGMPWPDTCRLVLRRALM